MIPASLVYSKYGIPRAAIRALADAGVVKSVERQLDEWHTMRFYDEQDIEAYIAKGSSDNA